MKENITVESIEKLGKRNARTSLTLTRPQIEKDFRLFGSVIPASSADQDRRRTPYFFRKWAIRCAHDARRHRHWRPRLSLTLAVIAKRYLATYRRMKGAN
jgi:hypothetical protein